MIYGLSQYYNDELKIWSRLIAFCKEEVEGSISKITIAMDQSDVSPAQRETSDSIIDQFIDYEQKFDHITNQIISQQQRIERLASFPDMAVEPAVDQLQKLLRTRMKAVEANFLRDKYACSFFLSALLHNYPKAHSLRKSY
jgi:hypothetical protein